MCGKSGKSGIVSLVERPSSILRSHLACFPLFQCERGTALHEAAMCGKSDTVELLLDKGVNLQLKDAEGHTVLEVMEQFPAGQAAEIRRKIQSKGRGRGLFVVCATPPHIGTHENWLMELKLAKNSRLCLVLPAQARLLLWQM